MATYALVSVLSLFFIFAVIGVFSTGELFLQGRIFQGFFSGTLLMVVLQIRAYHIEKNRQLAVTQLEIKQREIDVEWQHQEEKSQFLGILAHDLKTPLALIKMILGIKEFSVEHVNHLNNAVNDMNTVIERCLQVSQVEDNKLDLVLEKVDLFGLLMDKKKQSIAAKRINIYCHDSIYLITDDQLLRIILSNLVDNANKYSDPYTTIEIKVRRDSQGDKDGVAISIINMPGRFGFPDPEKVFQKYYRANNNTRLSGTGQGLYLVANLAKMLGGNIRYIPDQAYVCFTLWLPNNFNERSQSGVDAG
jgi:signal transduction histidine kinase